MTGSVYALLTGGATHQFSTQVTWYTCMHQGTNSLSLSLSPFCLPQLRRPAAPIITFLGTRGSNKSMRRGETQSFVSVGVIQK